MELTSLKIDNTELDLSTLKQGIIKYNYVKHSVLFDSLFVSFLKLDNIKCNSYIQDDNKEILKNNDIYKLVKFIKNAQTEEEFRKFKFKSKDSIRTVYCKKIIQLDDEYIYSYLVSPKIDKFLRYHNTLSNMLEYISDVSSAKFWWVDFSEGYEQYYDSYILYGTKNENYTTGISDFQDMMNRAADLRPEYKELIRLEQKSFDDCILGITDTWHGKYPILSRDNEIVWIETIGKVVSRDKQKKPILIIGVDTIISNEIAAKLEGELFEKIIDKGLNNSNIGIWIMSIENGKEEFKYNDKIRELYGFSNLCTSNNSGFASSDEWELAKKKVIDKYPEYITFFEEDQKKYEALLNGLINEYKSIIPLFNSKGFLNWLEIRSNAVSKDDNGVVNTISGAAIDITDLFESKIYQNLLSKKTLKVNKANRLAIEMSNLLIFSIDFTDHPNGEYLYGNENFIEILGLDKNSDGLISIEQYLDTIIENDEYSLSENELEHLTKEIHEGKIDGFQEILVKHKNLKTGNVLYAKHFVNVHSRESNGKVSYLSGYLIEVTKEINEKKLNEMLQNSINKYQSFNKLAVRAGELLVFNINYLENNFGNNIYVNDVFLDKLEITTDQNFIKYDDYYNTLLLDEEGRELFSKVNKEYKKIIKGEVDGVSKFVTKHKTPINNKILYLEHNSQVQERISNGTVVAVGGFLKDITNEVLNERKIKYLAEMDMLTEVYNRNKFEDFTGDISFDVYTIVIFDIDGLKLVNDIYGHYMGDKVLKDFSDFIKDVFKDDFIFRIGGDEFSIILRDIDSKIIDNKIKEVDIFLRDYSIRNNFQISVSTGYEIVLKNDPGAFKNAFTEAENVMYRKKLSNRSSRKSRILDTLLYTLSEKTEESTEHCERLAFLASEVLKELGFSRDGELSDISLSAKLHDIGKISVSYDILNKAGKLTSEEYEEVKKHSDAGYKIIINILNSDHIAESVLHHHEKWDGSGYPYGLKGLDIPLYSRIISVCDAFDIMTSQRLYSDQISIDDAIKELRSKEGTQFDPEIVDVLIKVVKSILSSN
ncbi:diguanylate cyclase [Mycoplasmatota bacterium zrk1]